MGQKHSGWAPMHRGTRASSISPSGGGYHPRPNPQVNDLSPEQLRAAIAASDQDRLDEYIATLPRREDNL